MTYLKLMRSLKDISIEDLLEKIGYSRNSKPYYYWVERGVFKGSQKLKTAISEFFELPEDLLFDEDNLAIKINMDILKKAIRKSIIEQKAISEEKTQEAAKVVAK